MKRRLPTKAEMRQTINSVLPPADEPADDTDPQQIARQADQLYAEAVGGNFLAMRLFLSLVLGDDDVAAAFEAYNNR